jgi:hypothetical protein
MKLSYRVLRLKQETININYRNTEADALGLGLGALGFWHLAVVQL